MATRCNWSIGRQRSGHERIRLVMRVKIRRLARIRRLRRVLSQRISGGSPVAGRERPPRGRPSGPEAVAESEGPWSGGGSARRPSCGWVRLLASAHRGALGCPGRPCSRADRSASHVLPFRPICAHRARVRGAAGASAPPDSRQSPTRPARHSAGERFRAFQTRCSASRESVDHGLLTLHSDRRCTVTPVSTEAE
jgi:hypothetical protein